MGFEVDSDSLVCVFFKSQYRKEVKCYFDNCSQQKSYIYYYGVLFRVSYIFFYFWEDSMGCIIEDNDIKFNGEFANVKFRNFFKRYVFVFCYGIYDDCYDRRYQCKDGYYVDLSND